MNEIEDRRRPEGAEDLFGLLAGTRDGVFAVDRHQRIVFWNDAARQILGFEPGSVLGRLCYEVIGGTDEQGCAVCSKECVTFRSSLRGKLSTTRDVEVRTRGEGRKWVNLSTFHLPSRWHALSLLAHVFRNASQVKQLEFRLNQVVRQATPGSFSEAAPPQVDALTPRECEVLNLLASGTSTDKICAVLQVERTTVRSHVARILEKLGVHSRLEAVASAVRNGWLGVSTDR